MKLELADLPTPIKEFLVQQQFAPKEITKNSRYFILHGTMSIYDGQLFLKINRKDSTALLQKNHVIWTKSFQTALPQNAQFGVAPILDSGRISGKYRWVLSPFIEGVQFSVEHKGITTVQVKDPENCFPRIVDLMRFIQKAPIKSLQGIDLRVGGINRNDKLQLFEEIISWARDDTPYLAELLQLVSKNYQKLSISPGHGDFKDTNIIIDTKGRPIIVDAEWGGTHRYKYHDAAEFYNRLYTLACRPELARKFLKTYLGAMPKSEQQRFLGNFLCISAQRCIGNFAEIEEYTSGNEKAKRLEFARKYAEEILSYNILG